MQKSFLHREKPPAVLLFSAETEKNAIETIRKAVEQGAEGFCIQTEVLHPEYRNRSTYERLIRAAGDLPVYVTNYRYFSNIGLSDEAIAQGLLEMAESGAALCDIQGDLFRPSPGEITTEAEAVERQCKLVEQLHARGAEVLMSSHVYRFTEAERVLEIAECQQARGVDVVKIVTGAENQDQQLENLRITHLLKERLSVPYLFLSGGCCDLHRQVGPMLGCCMYLCSMDDSGENPPEQPMLRKVKRIRDNWRFYK